MMWYEHWQLIKGLGKLLTTPSRLLKLILPLPPTNANDSEKEVEPLVLLIHPKQPLSYLERLIQSELPTVQNSRGDEKAPLVYFRAEDPDHEALRFTEDGDAGSDSADRKEAHLEATKLDGESFKTGKLNGTEERTPKGTSGEDGVETSGALGQESAGAAKSDRKSFVRWSASTEIGDFIRDAARGTEFAIEIEGYPDHIRVGVPSFNDRTHYLRTRLRKLSGEIADLASLKAECDQAAYHGARRMAMGGFGLLVGWWYVVYWLTFQTSKGWDYAEPLTVCVLLNMMKFPTPI